MESAKIIAVTSRNSIAIIDNGVAEGGGNVAIQSIITIAYLLM